MKITPPDGLIHAILLGWTSTWRLIRSGEERFERTRRLTPHGGCVGAMWHRSLLAAIAVHHHRRVAALLSRSGDGALLAEHFRRTGFRVVRGSSHRGAVQAVRELAAAIDDGWTLALACDGPRGPARVPKAGAVDLARRHHAPIQPVGFAAGRYWQLPTWDGLRIPWPGTRVAVVYGEPIVYGSEQPDDAELARRTAEVAAAIDACEEQAARLLGHRT